ncbi:aminoacyl-tRNA hydrolase [Lichenihabitans sp. Uapishka_5]|uniref:aminoacyl-tRNA hydrolase n=1 Tax=Lichenihabitans sp. Uapishka_5 TaxID=3037302 RepID=UPI0029E81A18|nr:aminoacyl-tRNA hydrolase [Lichenihabitans sp. Uapishka_5]MDX7949960.1 aminoacyl-tRNA hydrolase [Lichenihabitans sp. Uapishka_5]
MLILAGLGNPGSQYANNRHNIGFMAIDALARRHGFPAFRSKFQGLASEGTVGGERAVLLKPSTYMNDSGRSVGEAMRFYKVALADITVLHDELDLAAGRLRVKLGGGNAGHNGLRSITALCGNDYRRVRLGIGHPGDKTLVHAYVLSDFAKSERPWVESLCSAVAAEADLLVSQQDAAFQNKVFRATEADLPPG